ncbi:MAG: SDR family oxidoreductase [Pseudomonadota bacterium]
MSDASIHDAPLAFVSGAAKRIGRAVALHLAERGWDIAAQHRGSDPAAVAEITAAIEGLGRRCAWFEADFSDPAVIEPLCDAVCAWAGPPQLVINSASLFLRDQAGAARSDLFQSQMTVNALHPVLVTESFARRAAAPMLAVNFLDQKIENFSRDYFTYTLSKVALAAATKIHAFSLGPQTRVCGIAPGIVLPSGGQSWEEFEEMARRNPARAIPTLEEICATIDLMWESGSLNGSIIYLDGGRHLGADAGADDMGVDGA